MRALILAAGLGTRLRPLTDTTPKPLVLLNGRPMICYALDWLEKNGITEVMINSHHHADQMEDFVTKESKRRPKLKLVLQDERALLLGSGGSVRKAAPWLFANKHTALVYNADALMTPDLRSLEKQHQKLYKSYGVLSTLAVMSHVDAGRRYNAFSVENGIIREHIKADKNRQGEFYHFPGVYIVESEAAQRLQAEPEAFSIAESLWYPLIAEGKLGAWIYQGEYRDLGTPADLKRAEADLARGLFGRG